MQHTFTFNPAYYAPKLAACTHALTGRTTLVNLSNEVLVSCARCGATLDTIPCDTERQARFTALSEQRDPDCEF